MQSPNRFPAQGILPVVLAAVCLVGGVQSAEPDPEGRPESPLFNVTARYYIWRTPGDDMWHVRLAARKKRTRRFQGTVRVSGGSIGKCRAIGLEYGLRTKPKKKGIARSKDAWRLNAERTELVFVAKTTGNYDGFDFAVKRISDADTELMFDLKIEGKHQREKIFIGRGEKNPRGIPFSIAVPKKK